MTGVDFAVTDLLPLAAERIPTFAGVKFTDMELMDYQLAADVKVTPTAVRGERLPILFGRDEFLLAGLALGATGGVGGTYALAAPLYRRITDAFARGDLEAAHADQLLAAKMISIMCRYGGLRAGKAIFRFLLPEIGPPRQPLTSLSGQQCDALRRDLDAIGFFDFCTRAAP